MEVIKLIPILLLATQTVALTADDGRCNGFEAEFNVTKLSGVWHVVAVVPEYMYPKGREVPCYKVEFSETDVAGLRWLVNQTIDAKHQPALMDSIEGLTIRQRYHSEVPFDVWSRAIEGTKGCFEQVLSLNNSMHQDIDKAVPQNSKMQLHLLKTSERDHLLVQLMWGIMLSAVIYSRTQHASTDNLRLVRDFVDDLRGKQREMKVCGIPLTTN